MSWRSSVPFAPEQLLPASKVVGLQTVPPTSVRSTASTPSSQAVEGLEITTPTLWKLWSDTAQPENSNRFRFPPAVLELYLEVVRFWIYDAIAAPTWYPSRRLLSLPL
ncbi:hypothetical protein FRC08_002123 [Ceratobasidium sp. 394]|nr:hypothetical protein FRC08_002123 [Ceratobasidium sp. 394]